MPGIRPAPWLPGILASSRPRSSSGAGGSTATLQASGTISESSGADITPVNPTHQADDILLLHAAAENNTVTLATPAGWTAIAGPIDQGTAWRNYWFYKRATSGAETNPLCDWSGTSGNKTGRVYVIRGAINSGNPFAATATSVGANSADPGSATGVTTAAGAQLVLAIGSVGNVTPAVCTGVAITATDPATLTTSGFAGVSAVAAAVYWAGTGTRAAAGATGNIVHDFTGSIGSSRGWAILTAAVTGV